MKPGAGQDSETGAQTLEAPGDVYSRSATVLLAGMGVALPLFSLGVEATTRLSSDIWVDPIPTLGHLALVLLVIATNALTIRLLGTRTPPSARLLQANRLSLAVALIYSLVYLPVTPLGIYGVLLYGLGLATFGPTGALMVVLFNRYSLKKRTPNYPRFWPGLGLALGLLTAFEGPSLVTELGLRFATASDPSHRATGLALLRGYGSEYQILAGSNWGTRRQSGPMTGLVRFTSKSPEPWKVQKVYHRVTGKDPSLELDKILSSKLFDLGLDRGGRFDPDRGGARVGRTIPKLNLSASTLLGSIDADAALGYLEWTLEFSNTAARDHEARAIVELPHDATVSRVTLWVNGQPREASFAGRGQVRRAYTNIVRRSQDPVLVTTAGRDRVMVQCFPVPAEGARTMKIRLGITTPVLVARDGHGELRLPRLLSTNFGADQVKHEVHLASGHPLAAFAPSGPTASWLAGDFRGAQELKALAGTGSSPSHELKGRLTEASLQGAAGRIRVQREPESTEARTEDTRGHDGREVRQVLHFEPQAPPAALVLAIDASRALAPHQEALAAFLEALPPELPVGLVLAEDALTDSVTYYSGAADLSPTELPAPGRGQALAARLRSTPFVGGQDTAAALFEGIHAAGTVPGGVVFWLHGPTLLETSWGHSVRAWLDAAPHAPAIWQLQLAPGPAPPLRKLDTLPELASRLRTGEVSLDLDAALATLKGRPTYATASRTRAAPSAGGEAKRTSLHLARLWAADEIRGRLAPKDNAALTELAHTYQVVSPVSGAVVLETDEQTLAAGLTPGEPGRVPTIPEPGALALLALVGGVFGAGRRRSTPASVRP